MTLISIITKSTRIITATKVDLEDGERVLSRCARAELDCAMRAVGDEDDMRGDDDEEFFLFMCVSERDNMERVSSKGREWFFVKYDKCLCVRTYH